MRLRKGAETEMRVIDEPQVEHVPEEQTTQGGMQLMTLDGETPPDDGPEGELGAVECDVWYDLDGNAVAWSPVGSGVISIEIGEKDEDAPVDVYQALRDAQRANKSAEERITELEQMVARLAAAMAE